MIIIIIILTIIITNILLADWTGTGMIVRIMFILQAVTGSNTQLTKQIGRQLQLAGLCVQLYKYIQYIMSVRQLY